jgi:hypothetical protein
MHNLSPSLFTNVGPLERLSGFYFDFLLLLPEGAPSCFFNLVIGLFGWLVADGWCWFVLREEYCWLVAAGCWWLVRSERKVLLAGG